MIMSEPINWCDLKKNIKHIGEVSTSHQDGKPTGAEILTSTNEVTGQVRDTLEGKLRKMDAQFQDRFATLEPIEWAAGIKVTNPLQVYKHTVDGVERTYLADPLKIPFTTEATFAEDAVLNRWVADDIVLKRDVDGQLKGIKGRNNFYSATVLRRDTSISADWFMIDDSAHVPVNIDSIETHDSYLKINHKDGSIGAIVAVTDETFAMDGVTVGGSGGTTHTNLQLGGRCNFEIDIKTGVISTNERYFSPDRMSYTLRGDGNIHLSHPPSRTNFAPSITHTVTKSTDIPCTPHYIRSTLGSGTDLFLASDACGIIEISSKGDISIRNSIWSSDEISYKWNAAGQELTVSHPMVINPLKCDVTSYSSYSDVALSVFGVKADSFTVKFTKLDLSPVELGGSVAIIFDRGLSINKRPTGKLIVDLGHVSIRPIDVNVPSGNVWFMTVNSEDETIK